MQCGVVTEIFQKAGDSDRQESTGTTRGGPALFCDKIAGVRSGHLYCSTFAEEFSAFRC